MGSGKPSEALRLASDEGRERMRKKGSFGSLVVFNKKRTGFGKGAQSPNRGVNWNGPRGAQKKRTGRRSRGQILW